MSRLSQGFLQVWRYLVRENPMQIEALRAVRRFTATGGQTEAIQRQVVRGMVVLLALVYLWFLLTIVIYREDISAGIFWFELLLLTLLVPGSLYGAISGERERLTWDSLILTPLSPARILAGKLLWRLLLAGGILLVFTPPLLLTHFLTSHPAEYTTADLLWMQLCLAAWAVLLATLTLWISTCTRRSVVTLASTLVALLVFLILIPCLIAAFGSTVELNPFEYTGNGYGRERGVLYEEGMPRYTLLHYLGSLLVHVNPGYALGEMMVQRQPRTDFWRDFLAPGFGVFTLLPFLYLGLAGLCLRCTLKALARLGLPERGRG